jgi:hypothetical protein
MGMLCMAAGARDALAVWHAKQSLHHCLTSLARHGHMYLLVTMQQVA